MVDRAAQPRSLQSGLLDRVESNVADGPFKMMDCGRAFHSIFVLKVNDEFEKCKFLDSFGSKRIVVHMSVAVHGPSHPQNVA